ncbi:hypothetical protein COCNU_16G007200 [Cocos nucifera]|uniref:Uncharacterized protein n=1 Tax=Cocos nucifera TaxID=13894 RepID=A0A8K0IYS5_COCNU|nr:hypothetical protein COCNU_16G007200 [Cocos nucifera]
MSKLRLLGSALKPRVLTPNPVPRFPLMRSLSTTEGESQDSSNDPHDSSNDPFLQPPNEGLVFGRLTGIGRNTLKTDVIHFFEGCNLSTDDVKVEYNREYYPVGMLLQFPSRSLFDMAMRQTIRKGRLYKIEKADRSQWDLTRSYEGKAVLLQGIPRNALQEDVDRFLHGCNYDPSTFQTFVRPGFPDPMRFALVHFPTRNDAMNAFCTKNRSFCLNNSITMRVLQ